MCDGNWDGRRIARMPFAKDGRTWSMQNGDLDGTSSAIVDDVELGVAGAQTVRRALRRTKIEILNF